MRVYPVWPARPHGRRRLANRDQADIVAHRTVARPTVLFALLLVVGLLVTLGGCGFSFDISCGTESGKTSGKLSTYTDPDFGFSFQYPEEWKIEEGNSGEITAGANAVKQVVAYDPAGASVDGHGVNLAQVSVYKLKVVVDESMMDAVRQEMESLLVNLESQDSSWHRTEELTQTKVGNLPGFRVSYDFSLDGKPAKTTFYFLFTGDMQYQLTLQTVAEDWENYEDEFKGFVDSFSVASPSS